MYQYILKVLISASIIVLATEISKRSSILAAFIIALPLVSLLTFCWIYYESKDTLKIANLSYEILYFQSNSHYCKVHHILHLNG